jgi:hypothetical protein
LNEKTRRASSFLVVSFVSLSSCRPTASADAQCSGAAPACFDSLAEGCCGDAGAPAECGPKDAPRGTVPKWICPGATVPASECRAYGAACLAQKEQVAPTLTAPHAVVPGSGIPPEWLDASAGTLVADVPEPLGPFYAVHHTATRVTGPDQVKQVDELWFGKTRLTAGPWFAAPGTSYVAFADGGRIAMHNGASGMRRDTKVVPFEAPADVAWDLGKHVATVSFAKHAPMTLALP